MKPLIIGITGNIAAGKSTVTAYFRKLGFPVIDADDVSRAVVAPGSPALATLKKEFGSTVLNIDGSLNRSALKELVFADEGKRRRLEEILHPAIAEESRRQWQALHKRGHRVAFYDAALLVEASRHKEMDGVMCITAPSALQKERLLQRPGLTEDLATRMMAAQLSQEKKAAVCRWVLKNEGTVDELEAKAAEVLREIMGGMSDDEAHDK
jgi:dephospho-CoA kinase